MTEPPASEVLGRWRIVEIEGSETGYVDMLGPVHIQLNRNSAGQNGLDSWYIETGAHFIFQGHEEGTEVSGDSDADLEDGSLTGEIRFYNGDEMPFIARRG